MLEVMTSPLEKRHPLRPKSRVNAGCCSRQMKTEATLLFNPLARRGGLTPNEIEYLRSRLADAGIDLEVEMASEGGAAPDLTVRLKDKDLLIVCGGDGTIHRVLPHVVDSGITLGIIP